MTVFTYPTLGPALCDESDALDLIGDIFAAGADAVAIPVQRLAADFWDLSNQKAGFFIQKLINYRLRVIFVGDLSAPMAASSALRAFVIESNRGPQVHFADDDDAVAALGW